MKAMNLFVVCLAAAVQDNPDVETLKKGLPPAIERLSKAKVRMDIRLEEKGKEIDWVKVEFWKHPKGIEEVQYAFWAKGEDKSGTTAELLGAMNLDWAALFYRKNEKDAWLEKDRVNDTHVDSDFYKTHSKFLRPLMLLGREGFKVFQYVFHEALESTGGRVKVEVKRDKNSVVESLTGIDAGLFGYRNIFAGPQTFTAEEEYELINTERSGRLDYDIESGTITQVQSVTAFSIKASKRKFHMKISIWFSEYDKSAMDLAPAEIKQRLLK